MTSPLFPLNGQWEGELNAHLTGARRKKPLQHNFKENPETNQIIWSLNHVKASDYEIMEPDPNCKSQNGTI